MSFFPKFIFTVSLSFAGSTLPAQDSSSVTGRKFAMNVYGALEANTSLANIEYAKLYPKEYDSHGAIYTRDSKASALLGFAGGFEGSIEIDKRFKLIFGINYELTNSVLVKDVAWAEHGHGYDQTDTTHLHYDRRVQFAGLNMGIQSTLFKKIKITLTPGISKIIQQRDIINGYDAFYENSIFTGSSTKTTYYTNYKAVSGLGKGMVGFMRLRCAYRFNKNLAVFASGNLGINYAAPWWMLGLQYYPFKDSR
jgi:hypothetical protein